ncbi:hypothetical protein [Agrobacterium tumefaciens]|uniref:hypothetical protein n=1 Tax=Agrobacterium tumefaciens TaxID=358 RepID=UPI00287E839D|nr:hypothetical protein [Agrobacterium tumefaciens]MDS7597133.1 hypothetical protein [Agrobacterium tumefaciens]
MNRPDITIQDSTIENALSVVARSQDMRERALERRRELQRRTEVITTRPLYVLKKQSGERQLSLKLDS